MFQLIDEAFHQVALAIEMLVIVAWFFTIAAWGNHGRRALRLNLCDKSVGIIALIGQHKVTSEAFDQGGAWCNVVDLPRGQAKAQPQSQGIYTQMQFAGEATFTAP